MLDCEENGNGKIQGGLVGERNQEHDSRREKKYGDPLKSTGSLAQPL